MRTAFIVILAALTAGCGDDPFQPERSVRLVIAAAGMPEGTEAGYRIFVDDTLAIAHGNVAGGETDTVRVSSSAALTLQWQNALARVGDADYVFAPISRDTTIDESGRDTTVALLGSYELASGGFVLSGQGIPVESPARWWVWSQDDSVLARGLLRSGEIVRRGDLPAGSVRLQLDTAMVELDGVHHAYTPPQREIILNVSASLDLAPVDATYSLASAVVQFSPSGIPEGTPAPWGLNSSTGYSFGGSTSVDSIETLELVEPGDYMLEWGEVTVEGITYVPGASTTPVTLQAGIEPHVFEMVYQAQP